MSTKQTKTVIYFIITICLTLGLSISLQSLLAAWTAPIAAPPSGNTLEPLTIGSNAQTKNGRLEVNNTLAANTFAVAGNSVFGGNFLVGINSFYINSTTGNIGIGTTNPSAALHINRSDVNNGIRLDESNNSDAANISFYRSRGTVSSPSNLIADDLLGSLNFYGYFGGGYENSAAITAEAQNPYALNHVDGKLIFSTSQNSNLYSRMVIESFGNVGIGTDAPKAKLDVNGGVKIDNDTGVCSAARAGTLRYHGAAIEYCDGSNWALVGGGGGWAASVNDIYNTNTGNIGIGTVNPSPGLKLDVEGKIGANEYCDENGGNCKTIVNIAAKDINQVYLCPVIYMTDPFVLRNNCVGQLSFSPTCKYSSPLDPYGVTKTCDPVGYLVAP